MYGIAVHPTQPMLVTSDSQGRIDQWFVLADCQTPPGFDLTASVCFFLGVTCSALFTLLSTLTHFLSTHPQTPHSRNPHTRSATHTH